MNEIELLEYKIDNLTEMVKTLTSVTKDIYQQLGISDKLTEQKLQPKTEPVLVKKTTINWDGLVKAVAGTKSEEFVLNVYNNGYSTLTENSMMYLSRLVSRTTYPWMHNVVI